MGVSLGGHATKALRWTGTNLFLVVVIFVPAWYGFLWLATSVSAGFETDHSVWARGILFFMMMYVPAAMAASLPVLLLLFLAKRRLSDVWLRAVTIAISSIVLPAMIVLGDPAIVRDIGDALAIVAAAGLFGLAARLNSPAKVGGAFAQDRTG